MGNITSKSSEIAAAHFSKGDVVKIVNDAVWSTGSDVPTWVINKEWIVSHASTSDSYVLIDKSVDGLNSIKSSIKYSYLIPVKSEQESDTTGTYYGMKYSPENPPMVCMATKSSCYNGTTLGVPVGVLWHSTGANNPRLSRYVQPSPDDVNKDELIRLIGKNTGKNDWNNYPIQCGLNAWVGKLADGSITSIQTLPWNYRAWGCGSGKNGSCNGNKNVKNSPFWLQFEICEDNLKNKDYFEATYREAVELTAYWCKLFNLDPHGTVMYNGVKVPVILCHYDSYFLGLGSNHSDVTHWFKLYGKTMDDVRNDVAKLLENSTHPFVDVNEGDWFYNDVLYAYNNGIMNGVGNNKFNPQGTTTRAMVVATLYRISGSPSVEGLKNPFEDVKSGTWYYDAVIWAYNNNITQGTTTTTFSPDAPVTREQVASFLYRYAKGSPVNKDISNYPDFNDVSSYAKDAMAWAVENGILNGTVKDKVVYLAPKAEATRAQTAAILARYMK